MSDTIAQRRAEIDTAWHPLADGCPPEWASEWGQDHFGIFVAFSLAPEGGERITQRLRWIPPGGFLMGSPEDEPERYSDESPQHAVTLSQGFWLFDTACTQALWQAVMGNHPSKFQDAERPVESVRWDDVQEFLQRINTRVPGLELTLPSEAQWEYACRAGTTSPFSFGNNISPEQVNYDGNYPYAGAKKGLNREQTVAVKSLPPNPWGLYEMHGNVWEWCADAQRDYDDRSMVDPVGPDSPGAGRVVRGGSWGSLARRCRSAFRSRLEPGRRDGGLGFRCARGQS